MSDHAQSTLEDAAKWREVVRDLVSCGMAADDITPEMITGLVRKHLLRVGVDYVSLEHTGFRCYEDAEYNRR